MTPVKFAALHNRNAQKKQPYYYAISQYTSMANTNVPEMQITVS